MLTGKDISDYFEAKSGFAYSGYLDTVKKNRLFKNALYVCSDKKYMTLEEQKTFDEIASSITTERVFSINSNQILTSALQITGILFSANTASITTFFPHNLTSGESVTISNVQGTALPVINGTYTVIVTSTTTFNIPYIYVSGLYTPNTGSVTTSKLIEDYMHLYAVKCKFEEPQFDLTVNSTTNASPINVYWRGRNKFRSGSIIKLSNMTATTAANGTWYYKYLNSVHGALYHDADLQNPTTAGVASSSPQGNVSYIWYEYATPLFSDRKIDPYEQATPDDPKYETAGKMLKFYPRNRTCSEITIDYISLPKIFIDSADTSFDYGLIYPERYIFFIIDMIIRLYSTPLRDTLLAQDMNQQLIQNP